jgi:hypothetical protein
MKYFDLIQKTLFEIKDKIRLNEDIQKLVVYDTPNALALAAPGAAQADPKIRVTAVFDITEPPYDHNTFITIVATKIQSDMEEQIFSSIIRINIITQAQLWELAHKKIRPVEIANIIVTMLENFKSESGASHKLFFKNADLIVLDGNINGYGLIFHLLEGSGLDDEF